MNSRSSSPGLAGLCIVAAIVRPRSTIHYGWTTRRPRYSRMGQNRGRGEAGNASPLGKRLRSGSQWSYGPYVRWIEASDSSARPPPPAPLLRCRILRTWTSRAARASKVRVANNSLQNLAQNKIGQTEALPVHLPVEPIRMRIRGTCDVDRSDIMRILTERFSWRTTPGNVGTANDSARAHPLQIPGASVTGCRASPATATICFWSAPPLRKRICWLQRDKDLFNIRRVQGIALLSRPYGVP